MEPNNFDKDIQQKFNSREIEPSAQAWDRLDAMLTVAEEKKRPKNFFWLSSVATFLVFTGIGYIFFQQNSKPEMVQPKNEIIITQETPSNDVENFENEAFGNSNETAKQLAIASPKNSNSRNEKVSKPNDYTKTKSKLETYLTVIEKENKTTQQEQLNEKPEYNYVNPETLLAEVQGQKNSSKSTNTYKSTIKVNSEDLLSSVESELNQSFKEKALTKFKQAKTAIVNRNYN